MTSVEAQPFLPTALPAEIPAWRAWSAGLLLVAGVMHLSVLDAHLQQARGTGIYFFLIGAGQILWAIIAVLRPARRMARLGLALFTVAPATLWLLTRLFRSPWGDAPEPMDFVSLATTALQLTAAGILALARKERAIAEGLPPRLAAQTVAVLVVLGVALGTVSYAGAMAAEVSVPWLAEGEAEHHQGAAPASPTMAGDGHPHAASG